MMKFAALVLGVLVLGGGFDAALADNKALRQQRQEAQKERQALKKERSTSINEATRSFREFARELKMEYKARLRDLDTEFKLRQVDIRAEHQASLATAQAEFQRKLMGLFTNDEQSEAQTLETLQADVKALSDEQFRLQKQYAEAEHQERLANERRKHELLDEQDNEALAQAQSLGLSRDYAPILATAIGDGLTKQEQSWNTREEKEVERIRQRNNRTLSEFTSGQALRAWELQNLDDDFRLTWLEKEELHAINSQTSFYNLFAMQSADQVDRNELADRLSKLSEQTQLARIKYNKLRKQESIKRREEKRELQGK